jgi:predicted nucleic acid-binding protein
MSSVVLDASVLISAAEPADSFHVPSRDLLTALVTKGASIHVPAFAVVEISCALARRLGDPVAARALAIGGLSAIRANELPMDSTFLAHATLSGTRQGLRGADSPYATAAELSESTLISWDTEHRKRAGALSPKEWLAQNP